MTYRSKSEIIALQKILNDSIINKCFQGYIVYQLNQETLPKKFNN